MRQILLLIFILTYTFVNGQPKQLPKGFVYITTYIPHIAFDLRYCGHNNFLGVPVDGYLDQKLILTHNATLALQKAEAELNKESLGFKVFDAYRPQSAVNHFKRWANQIKDTLKKAEFYPTIDKRILFKAGFIASRSGHSRGSTIDLTIINLETGKELDMGSPFDFFGDISGHNYTKLTLLQKKNRAKLKSIMEKYGFKAYEKEWWHYTLIHEPFKETYYDFPVQ